MMQHTYTFPIKTILGLFVARISALGIQHLYFPDFSAQEALIPRRIPQNILTLYECLSRELQLYTGGSKVSFTVPLDLTGATEFRLRVWSAIQKISYGKTHSYGELAAELHCDSAQAIGQACGANPVPILIPCHRVIAAGGALGGFSSDQKWKIQLLELEGISVVKTETDYTIQV